jgi:hypothetical protein
LRGVQRGELPVTDAGTACAGVDAGACAGAEADPVVVVTDLGERDGPGHRDDHGAGRGQRQAQPVRCEHQRHLPWQPWLAQPPADPFEPIAGGFDGPGRVPQ